MKRKLIYIFITVMVIMWGCKQYEHTQIEDSLISSYEESKGKSSIKNYDYTPDWGKKQVANGGYYIPLSSSGARFSRTLDSTVYSLADKSWLFAFKKDGDWFFNVLTVFPDDLKDVKAGGIIVSEDLLNGKTSFVNYLDNKFISKNEILKVYASSKNKFAKERVKTCRQIWIQYCLDGTEICSSTWKEVCTDDVVDPNFPDFPPFTDGCEGCSSGGSGSGSGTGGEAPSTDPDADKEIRDSLQGYPCAQAILAKIPNLENRISRWLKKEFGENVDNDVIFRVSTKLDPNVDGVWSGSISGSSQTISLNANMLSTASQEYIAATMFHEALHGFLTMEKYRLKKEGKESQFGILYPGFTEININGQPRFVKGHNAYGSLLNDLAAALSSFNPNISDSDAMALSKVGVVNDFSEAEKNKVIKHREGNDGTTCN